jgi:hypothetical protein
MLYVPRRRLHAQDPLWELQILEKKSAYFCYTHKYYLFYLISDKIVY